MPSLSRRMALALPAAALALARLPAMAKAALSKTWQQPDGEWHGFARDGGNTRYSPLDQINAANFNKLEVAWRFKTDALGARKEYQFESTPLMVGGVIYSTAGARRDVVALDAVTGELLWLHREDEGERAIKAPRQLSGHGLSYWTDGKAARILYVTIGYRLVSLDARTGLPDAKFGKNGVVDLKLNDDQVMDLINGDIGLHATPAIAKDVVIVGAAHTAGNVPRTHLNQTGHIRGFDVRTGKRLWIFHTIPHKGEFGYDTWLDNGAKTSGNAGSWAQISVDEELNLCYVGIELPSGDEVGIFRKGPALFGESLVALDIHTGKRKWHYQMVHHGLWDRDVPCAAILCDIPVGGKTVKALAQPSKQCFLYVLNRETGEPVWPIEERPVPKGDVPGEWYSPTQPFPTKPPAYDVQHIGPDTVIDFTPELHDQAMKMLANYRYGSLFEPPSISTADGTWGTLVAPHETGGTNWPGGSYDPETNMVYVYSKNEVDIMGLLPVTDPAISDFPFVHSYAGTQLRPQTSMGAERPGAGGEGGAAPAARGRAPSTITRDGFRPGQLTIQGLPLMKPPYGSITAIDLKTGDIAWRKPHGETPDEIKNHPALKGVTIPKTGKASTGTGTLTTKTLVIAGEGGVGLTANGARGAMLVAYDKATGEQRGAVFMAAQASGVPMTYMMNGQQYILVAIGGGAYTGELVAYRLPRA